MALTWFFTAALDPSFIVSSEIRNHLRALLPTSSRSPLLALNGLSPLLGLSAM